MKKPQRHWTPSVRQQESKFIPSSGPEPHFLPTQTPTVDVSNLLVTDPYKKVYSNDQEYIKDVQSYEPKLIPPTLPRKEIEVNTIDLLNPIILDQGQAPPKASTPAFTGVQKVRNAILVELTGAMREFEDDFGKVTSDDTFHSPDFLSGNPEQLNEPVSRPMSPKRENEEKLSSTPYVAVPKKKTNKRPRHLAAHHQAPVSHFISLTKVLFLTPSNTFSGSFSSRTWSRNPFQSLRTRCLQSTTLCPAQLVLSPWY